mmetsp:Transcript_23516/g.51012  ORF Transcript_23516/g.51012 Transcript_23516/m.51012 type:complete len:118 (+) Transcript_23516:1910-2263(+)
MTDSYKKLLGGVANFPCIMDIPFFTNPMVRRCVPPLLALGHEEPTQQCKETVFRDFLARRPTFEMGCRGSINSYGSCVAEVGVSWMQLSTHKIVLMTNCAFLPYGRIDAMIRSSYCT